MGLRCPHTSIFIETQSLEGSPTKSKEDPSPHEMKLSPAGHQPSISWSQGYNNKCSCVRAGLNCSKFCDCQQCDDQSDMRMDDNEIEDENNDSESSTEDE